MSKLIVQGAKDIVWAQAKLASNCDRDKVIRLGAARRGWTVDRATKAVDSALKLSALGLWKAVSCKR